MQNIQTKVETKHMTAKSIPFFFELTSLIQNERLMLEEKHEGVTSINTR